MESILETAGLPEEFGLTLLVLSLILTLAPWLAGADFGIFRVPQVSYGARKVLRVLGPVCLLAAVLLHLPILRTERPERAAAESKGPVREGAEAPVDVEAEGPGEGRAETGRSRIGFVSKRDGSPSLYAMNPDGSDVRRLTDGRGQMLRSIGRQMGRGSLSSRTVKGPGRSSR